MLSPAAVVSLLKVSQLVWRKGEALSPWTERLGDVLFGDPSSNSH